MIQKEMETDLNIAPSIYRPRDVMNYRSLQRRYAAILTDIPKRYLPLHNGEGNTTCIIHVIITCLGVRICTLNKGLGFSLSGFPSTKGGAISHSSFICENIVINIILQIKSYSKDEITS